MSYPTSTILVPFAQRLPVPNGRLTPTQRGSANESTITTTLVIFDSQVTDLALLQTALLPGSIGHTIQPDQDPIDHITHLLTQTGATKLAIVAHGQPGAIQIGNGKIDRATLEARSGLLQEWGVDSIALYACEVGMNTEFIQRFGELTGAQIAASSGKLGAGNWELDGGMKLLSINQLADYSGKLATFNGTPGNDTAVGGTIIGFTGGSVPELNDPIGDIFTAGAGDDYVQAGNGDDVIDGGTGINYLDAGAGDDRIDSYMRDTIVGNAGNDFLYTHISIPTDAYTIEFTEGVNTGNFKINGTQTGTFTGIEQLFFSGGSGNDVINASLANPSVTSPGIAAGFGTFGLNVSTNAGNDIVLGSEGRNSIEGGSGDDLLYGKGAEDTILGDAGFDTIFGDAGSDTLSGGGLNDFIFGGNGNDIINGNEGEDYLYGEDDSDTINGGYGFDIIYGQAGVDFIYGEGVTFDAGGNETTIAPALGVGINDTIFGGIDDDVIFGGIGNDVLLGEEGQDYIFGGDGNDFIYGGIEGDSLYGEAGNDYIVGQDGDDYLVGGIGSDYLSGDAGDDDILGEDDNDFLYGNGGNDNIFGQAGNDFLDGGDGGDALSGGEGSDTIFGVEGDDTIYGENAEDYLYGGIGNDTILGEAGTDFLIGGAGSDILTGGTDSDKFLYFAMTDAGDTITDFNVAATGDKLNLSGLFASISVASSAVNTNYLQFIPVGDVNTAVRVDQDGTAGAYGFITMATLNSVTAAQLSFGVGGNVIV